VVALLQTWRDASRVASRVHIRLPNRAPSLSEQSWVRWRRTATAGLCRETRSYLRLGPAYEQFNAVVTTDVDDPGLSQMPILERTVGGVRSHAAAARIR